MKSGIYGVFIVDAGEWHLHGTFINRADALRELTYIRDMLGLRAEMFIKI